MSKRILLGTGITESQVFECEKLRERVKPAEGIYGPSVEQDEDYLLWKSLR